MEPQTWMTLSAVVALLLGSLVAGLGRRRRRAPPPLSPELREAAVAHRTRAKILGRLAEVDRLEAQAELDQVAESGDVAELANERMDRRQR